MTASIATEALAADYQMDTFKTKGGKDVAITAIKHASLRIQYDGLEIQIDPVAEYAPATDYSKFPKADVILVTHEHFDHFDRSAIATLTKDGSQIVANPAVQKMLGFGVAMANGESRTTAKGIKIDAVPAYNTSPEQKLTDIDIAFLPCNQPYTMTPEQVAKAAKTIKPKVLFPYHYSSTPIKRVAELLAGSGIDVRIRNYQ